MTLPTPTPAAPTVLETDPETKLQDERDRTELLLRTLCAALDPDLDPPPPSFRPGRARRILEAAATFVVRDHADGWRSLAQLAEALPGWQRRLVPGRVAWLEARLAGRTVTASYVDDERVLVLTVVSAPVAVTRAQSQRLRGVSS